MKQNVTIEMNDNEAKKHKQSYSYYSRVLEKPFDSIEELAAAEDAHFANIKAKEDAAAQKKNDALKVEDAFKALNVARKTYKENLANLTQEYATALDNLKNTFEFGKKDISNKLADAEAVYAKALKEFTDKHPEGYHLTLKDGDFETTISSQTTEVNPPVDFSKLANLFDLMFNFN